MAKGIGFHASMFAAALLWPLATSAAESPPPSVPIVEPDVVGFNAADLAFQVPGFPDPVIVQLRVDPRHRSKQSAELTGLTISYAGKAVDIDQRLLADVKDARVDDVSATAVRSQTGQAAIAIYVFDHGEVEFDWTVGGEVRKLDYRKK